MNLKNANQRISTSALSDKEYTELYAAKSIDTSSNQNNRSYKLFLEHHRSNEKPKSFNFPSSSFGPESAKCIAKFLFNHKNIRVLNLSGNCIGDEGIFAISEYLEAYDELIQLDVSGCNLTDNGCARLMKALIKNKSVIQLNLFSLSGTGRNVIGKEATVQLSLLLSKNKVIQSIDVSLTEINSDMMKTISNGIRFNAAVSSINFSNNMIRTKGASMLVKKLIGSSIQELYLANCKINDDASVAFNSLFSNNRTLRILDISNNELSWKFCSSISQNFMNSSLEELNLSNNNLGRGDLSMLSNAISHNKFIKVIDLSGCKLTSVDLRIIMKYIEINESLTDFIANRNSFNDVCGSNVAKFIEASKTIAYMSFDRCEIKDSNAKPMFEAIQNSKTMKNISMKLNMLKDPEPIINCLFNNKNIIVMDIENNDIDYRSYQRIRRLIRENKLKMQDDIQRIEDKGWILERTRQSISNQRKIIDNYSNEKDNLTLALEQVIDSKQRITTKLTERLKELSQISVKDHEQQMADLDALEHKKGYLESEIEIMNNEFLTCEAQHKKYSRLLKEAEDAIDEETKRQNEEFNKINIDKGTAIMMYNSFKEQIIKEWTTIKAEKEKARKLAKKQKKVKKAAKKAKPAKIKDTGMV